jgi:hypothetical protein
LNGESAANWSHPGFVPTGGRGDEQVLEKAGVEVVDWATMDEDAEELIATSGCAKGPASRDRRPPTNCGRSWRSSARGPDDVVKSSSATR